MDFHARVVLDTRFPDDGTTVDRLVDGLIDGLEVYGGTVTRTPAGRVGLIFTVPADSLREATSTALDVATAAGHPEPFALEVMPAAEFFRRAREESAPADAPVPPG
jgi:hypothetical protein